MTNHSPVILVVDDDEIFIGLIKHYLKGLPYIVITANGGKEALSILKRNPEGFDLVLLDKFMDDMNGLDVLQFIKDDPLLKILPVILQTSDTAQDKILEGIRAGAYYYLTKPFSDEQLQAVVANALRQNQYSQLARKELSQFIDTLQQIDTITLRFQTREQAHHLAGLLSNACGLNRVQEMGLMELLVNAVEHGNLAISYQEKTQLINDNRLADEINHRLTLPQYAAKFATVSFTREKSRLYFIISDQGSGFAWERYLDMHLDRIHDNHGRGIAMAKNVAFTTLHFKEPGNIVEASISLPE